PAQIPVSSPHASTRQAQFDELLGVCARAYLRTPMGQDHRLAYGVMRATAQQNMAEIEALARRGADITDAVLWKLLPYTDSAAHRADGAWVTVAPAIRGDLRAWYEAAGWISPGEWPAVARAIYAFVRRCVAVPAELDVACQSFAAL